jgi:hypothetical protein
MDGAAVAAALPSAAITAVERRVRILFMVDP